MKPAHTAQSSHIQSFTVLRWITCLLLLSLGLAGQAASCVAQDDAPTKLYTLAATLQNRGVYDRAVDEWNRFIAQYPSDARIDRAFHYRGVCQLKQNKAQDAAQSFEVVLKQYPKSELLEPATLYLGMSQYAQAQQGKAEMYDQAANRFARLLSEFPQSKSVPQALFYLGECLYQRGKKDRAIERYAELLAKYPHDGMVADALYALGVAQQESNLPAAAEKSMSQFLERFPENQLASEVLMRRGDARLALGECEAAAKDLGAAAAKPGFALADYAAFRQAAAVAELKRFEEAARLYAAMSQRFPRSPHAAESRLAAGKFYFQAGNLAAAREVLGRAAADPANALDAAHWTARILLKEKKPAEALAIVEKALAGRASGPMLAQVMTDQADALYELPGRRADAAARYAAVAAKFPDDPNAAQSQYMAALASLQERDYPGALRHAQGFLKRHSDRDLAQDVTYIAAESSLQLGHNREAARFYGQLLARWPEHADAGQWRVRHGLSLYLAQDYRGAIAALEPTAAAMPVAELRAEALYVIGNSHLELGEADRAVAALSASLTAAPRWRLADETLLALAQAQRRQNRLADARATLGRLIAEHPQSRGLDRAYYRLGECCYAAGDFHAAVEGYQQVTRRWPQGSLAVDALHGLAWSFMALGDYQGASQAATTLLEKHGSHKLAARARYLRGLARQQLGQLQPSADDLKAFLATRPATDRSDARYALGLCQVGLKQYADAVNTLEALLKEDPKYTAADKVLYELAWAEKSRAKPAEASAAFRRLGREHPASPLAAESLFHAAEYSYQQADYAGAANDYRTASERAGRTPLGEKAVHKLGWAYWRLKDFEKARAAFARQRQTWPQSPQIADATFLEAECDLELKKYEEALKLYAAVKNPTGKDFSLLTLMHAGQAAAKLNRWDESAQWLKQAAERFPQSPPIPQILYDQAVARQNQGRSDEAIQLYQQVIAKTERELAAQSQFMIGQIQAHQQKHAEAIQSFYKVAYGYSYPTRQAEAMYAAGQSLEALKNRAQAVKQYRELVEKFPESDPAAQARERIKAIQK